MSLECHITEYKAILCQYCFYKEPCVRNHRIMNITHRDDCMRDQLAFAKNLEMFP